MLAYYHCEEMLKLTQATLEKNLNSADRRMFRMRAEIGSPNASNALTSGRQTGQGGNRPGLSPGLYGFALAPNNPRPSAVTPAPVEHSRAVGENPDYAGTS